MAQQHAQPNGASGGAGNDIYIVDSSTPAATRTPATIQPTKPKATSTPTQEARKLAVSSNAFSADADSRRIYDAARNYPLFQFNRIECMDGDMAQNKDNGTSVFAYNPKAQVGEVCRLVLEHSALVQNSPVVRAERPEADLLAPYRNIARDKGYIANDANARVLINSANNAASTQAAMAAKEPIRVPLSTGKDLVVAPGVALDAGFTQVVLDFMAGTPAPQRIAPQFSNDDLTRFAESCNRNNGALSVGQCRLIGREIAVEHIQRRPASGRSH